MNDLSACLQILWDYLYMEHPLEKADAIIGFGSYDLHIPQRAARLYLDGWAPRILFTGCYGKGTLGVFHQTEAETYAAAAMREGVPEEAILVENRATNTGENIAFSRALFEKKGLLPRRIIAVHKPYMSRRVWASLRRQWPELEIILAPGGHSLRQHFAQMSAAGVPEDEIICSLVGDVQRMEVYAGLGYQVPQSLPDDVRRAQDTLVRAGYDRYIV